MKVIIKGPESKVQDNKVSFEVYLEGLLQLEAADVTVNFKAWDIENTDELFYTDSNSLAFMKRETDVYMKRYH